MGLVEVDQDCAVLEQFYRAGVRNKLIGRFEESIAALMKLREKVKAITEDSYVDHEQKSDKPKE